MKLIERGEEEREERRDTYNKLMEEKARKRGFWASVTCGVFLYVILYKVENPHKSMHHRTEVDWTRV